MEIIEQSDFAIVLDGQLPREHRHTLAEMNRSVFTARRNAAHERILKILQEEIRTDDRELRAQKYQLGICIIVDALQATRRSEIARDSAVEHYFSLLSETLNGCLALVNHELTLHREGAAFAEIIGKELLNELSEADKIISDSEKGLISTVNNILRFGQPILRDDTQSRMNKFTPSDHQRYNKALEEYRSFYEQLGHQNLSH